MAKKVGLSNGMTGHLQHGDLPARLGLKQCWAEWLLADEKRLCVYEELKGSQFTDCCKDHSYLYVVCGDQLQPNSYFDQVLIQYIQILR